MDKYEIAAGGMVAVFIALIPAIMGFVYTILLCMRTN